MKTIRPIGLLILLLLTYPIFSRGQKAVKGNGYILTQQRELSEFTSIELSSGIDMAVVQGASQPVMVEADDNLFPYIKTVVHDKILKIYIPDSVNIIKYGAMNILISMPELCDLKTSNGSKVDASPQIWELDKIHLEATTGSRIRIHVKAKQIQINARTSGIIEIRGNGQQLEAELKTNANLYARELKTENATLSLATGARAIIEVDKAVSYELCGNARLILRGNPVINKSEICSGSKFIREK